MMVGNIIDLPYFSSVLCHLCRPQISLFVCSSPPLEVMVVLMGLTRLKLDKRVEVTPASHVFNQSRNLAHFLAQGCEISLVDIVLLSIWHISIITACKSLRSRFLLLFVIFRQLTRFTVR